MRYLIISVIVLAFSFLATPGIADDDFWRDFNQQQMMIDQQIAADAQILNEMYRSSDSQRAFEEQKRHNEVMEEYAEKAERRARQVEMDKLERELYPERFEK